MRVTQGRHPRKQRAMTHRAMCAKSRIHAPACGKADDSEALYLAMMRQRRPP
jgi:hypothetical protein